MAGGTEANLFLSRFYPTACLMRRILTGEQDVERPKTRRRGNPLLADVPRLHVYISNNELGVHPVWCVCLYACLIISVLCLLQDVTMTAEPRQPQSCVEEP